MASCNMLNRNSVCICQFIICEVILRLISYESKWFQFAYVEESQLLFNFRIQLIKNAYFFCFEAESDIGLCVEMMLNIVLFYQITSQVTIQINLKHIDSSKNRRQQKRNALLSNNLVDFA